MSKGPEDLLTDASFRPNVLRIFMPCLGRLRHGALDSSVVGVSFKKGYGLRLKLTGEYCELSISLYQVL